MPQTPGGESLAPAARAAVDRLNRLAYSPAEVAALIGASKRFVYDEMNRGHLESRKCGHLRRITHDQLMTYLNGAA